jgi:hypothetical protein
MISWVIKNKGWLFDGIGVAVLLGLVRLGWYLFHRKAKPGVQVTTYTYPTTETPDNSKVFVKLDFSTILKTIESLPPLQQVELRKEYIGHRIEFTGKLNAAYYSYLDKDKIKVTLIDSNNSSVSAHCEVNAKDYPELKTMSKGREIKVQGEITDFNVLNSIDIGNINLFKYS